VTARNGQWRAGRNDPGQPVIERALGVPAGHDAEAAISEVAHRRHSRAEVPAQGLDDRGVEFGLRPTGHPVQGLHPAVGDQMDVTVNKSGKHGRLAWWSTGQDDGTSHPAGSTPAMRPASTNTVAPPAQNRSPVNAWAARIANTPHPLPAEPS
jgi:hypothetical protein